MAVQLSDFKALFKQRDIVFFVFWNFLLITVLLYPILPFLKLSFIIDLFFLVFLKLAKVPLVSCFPLIELSVNSEVRLFEILLFIAFIGCRRVHLIISIVKLRQIFPIGVFVDTVFLIPLRLLRIIQFVREQ